MAASARASTTSIAARVGRETDGIAATDGCIRVKQPLKAFCSARNNYVGLQGRGGDSRDDKGRPSTCWGLEGVGR